MGQGLVGRSRLKVGLGGLLKKVGLGGLLKKVGLGGLLKKVGLGQVARHGPARH